MKLSESGFQKRRIIQFESVTLFATKARRRQDFIHVSKRKLRLRALVANTPFVAKNPFMEKSLIPSLEKRYATKRFDPTAKLGEEQVAALIEVVRLTATSYGLQLMKLVVVTDPEIRKKLVEHAYNQTQITDASHLFVLCRERNLSAEQFENHVRNISDIRGVPPESLEKPKSNWMKAIFEKSQRDQEVWMEKQVYIALGNLLTAAAVLGVDACPMEGFKPEKFDEVLELEKLNLASVLVCPLGFRSVEDGYATAKKVRRPVEQFVVRK